MDVLLTPAFTVTQHSSIKTLSVAKIEKLIGTLYVVFDGDNIVMLGFVVSLELIT